MSKDRVSRPHGLVSPPETEMSEESLAPHTPFQAALLAAGRADGLSSGRKEKLVRNLSLAALAAPGFGTDELSDGADLDADFDPRDAEFGRADSSEVGSNNLEPGNYGSPGQGSSELGLQPDLTAPTAFKAGAKVAGIEGLAVKVVGAVAVTGALVWGGWQSVVGGSSPEFSAPNRDVPVAAPATSASAAGLTDSDLHSRQPGEPTGIVEAASRSAAPANSELVDESAAGSAKGARSRAKVSDSLAKELSLIDAARAALLRGEPQVALRTLNSYRSQFPRGALQAEATVQRVEALIAIGDRSSASTIGGAFLKRHPESPYSRRISSLLGSPREPHVDSVRKNK